MTMNKESGKFLMGRWTFLMVGLIVFQGVRLKELEKES
jgi:hypothetical protein